MTCVSFTTPEKVFAIFLVLAAAELSGAVLNATTAAAPAATVAPVAAAAAPVAVGGAATAVIATTTTTTTTTTAAAKAAAATTILTTAAATTTKSGKPRRLCAFPFWHRGQWHHQCLEYGSKGAQWCALTQNFTRDEEWRECARYDLMRYKCSIPFHHESKSHTRCQPLQLEPLALPTFWCALVPSVMAVTWQSLGTDWTFCEAPNATDVGYLKAIGQHRSLEEATTPAPVAGLHGNAVEATKPVASASASADSAGPAASDASSRPSSALGIALGIVGVAMAAVAVAAAFLVHRRHQYKRIDPLLSAEPAADKSSYGGMQAYHD